MDNLIQSVHPLHQSPLILFVVIVLFDVASMDAEPGSVDLAGELTVNLECQSQSVLSTGKIIMRYHTNPSANSGRIASNSRASPSEYRPLETERVGLGRPGAV